MINHPTVKPKNKKEYEIETGKCQRVQRNILKFLDSRKESNGIEKLLPCSLYKPEKLEEAVTELIDKGLIEKVESEDGDMYRLLDK